MKNDDIKSFFNMVAAKSGAYSIDQTKTAYYSLIKVIMGELRRAGTIELPDFGTFSIRIRKARKIKTVRGGIEMIPPSKELKYEPCYNLKHYVKNMATIAEIKG